MSLESSNGKKDTQSRKYQLTINNPIDKGFNHDKIKFELSELKSLIYYCMADEQAETHHTHLYIAFSSPVRFSTIKNKIPIAHIQKALGASRQNRDYITKSGKWENDDKHGTIIEGTFEEFGELPEDKQGSRTDLTLLYEMIKAGLSNFEIMESCPDYLLNLDKIERTRQMLKEEEYRTVFRELETIYIFGETNLQKTRSIMEEYGYENVYRVTDYKHPFDSYKNESVLVLDEYSSNFRIQDLNNYTDGYPLTLTARYSNKQACYTRVFIISNLDLREQYRSVQLNEPKVWQAFLRRVHKVRKYTDVGIFEEKTLQEYLYGKTDDSKHGLLKGATQLDINAPTPFD